MKTYFLLASLAALSTPLPAQTKSQTNISFALKEIRETARDICTTIQQSGNSSSTELSAEGKARLNSALSKIIPLGASAAVKYQSYKYNGLLQEQLLGALKNSDDCRLTVFRELKTTLIEAATPLSIESSAKQGEASAHIQYGGTTCRSDVTGKNAIAECPKQ